MAPVREEIVRRPAVLYLAGAVLVVLGAVPVTAFAAEQGTIVKARGGASMAGRALVWGRTQCATVRGAPLCRFGYWCVIGRARASDFAQATGAAGDGRRAVHHRIQGKLI